MPIDAATTALIPIEFQHDFVSEGGTLHPAVGPVIEQTGMLEHSVTALEAARAQGVLIVHAPISFQKGYPEIADNAFGLLETVRDSSSFEAQSWGSEIIESMAPQPADLVLEGKRGLDAFASTDLDFVLRGNNIETVAIAGFLTNACVESTARSAYENGYRVITLTDCMAATTLEAHTMTIANNFPAFSQPMAHHEFLREISMDEVTAA